MQPKSILTVTSAAPSLSATSFSDFESAAKLCHTCIELVAKEAGLPQRVEIVLADDFQNEVLARMRAQPDIPKQFEAERLLGRVTGINLQQDATLDHVIIVFDAKGWARSQGGSGRERLLELNLIAHEMAHPALSRIRLASRAAEGVIYPSRTPGEIARSFSRTVMDEYFADRIADIIVGQIFSKTTEGTISPAYLWDISGADYIGRLRELFDGAHTTLPGYVNAYRNHQIPLGDMWSKVANAVGHLLIMFIHARAHADADAATNIPLLEDPTIKDLPFVRLYLADTIPALLAHFRNHPPIASPDEWRAREAQVILAGESAIREIWKRLGLTFAETAARDFSIRVAAPLIE